MRGQAEGFHILDVHDDPPFVREGDREGDPRIFHPESERFRPLINKEHPFIGPQFFPEHQPFFFFPVCAGRLGPDLFAFDRQSYKGGIIGQSGRDHKEREE